MYEASQKISSLNVCVIRAYTSLSLTLSHLNVLMRFVIFHDFMISSLQLLWSRFFLRCWSVLAFHFFSFLFGFMFPRCHSNKNNKWWWWWWWRWSFGCVSCVLRFFDLNNHWIYVWVWVWVYHSSVGMILLFSSRFRCRCRCRLSSGMSVHGTMVHTIRA